jgi:hypothetical protein
MAQDDEAARKARADELRNRIAGLKGEPGDARTEREPSPGENAPAPPGEGMSPREFIHERMHELDRGDG